MREGVYGIVKPSSSDAKKDEVSVAWVWREDGQSGPCTVSANDLRHARAWRLHFANIVFIMLLPINVRLAVQSRRDCFNMLAAFPEDQEDLMKARLKRKCNQLKTSYDHITAMYRNIEDNVKITASRPDVKASAACAAGGAAVLGASGGLMGLTTGAGFGAAVGIIPAIFTFGLSIPIGAMIGGGTGLCVGTTVGGGVGFIGGGAVGFCGYRTARE